MVSNLTYVNVANCVLFNELCLNYIFLYFANPILLILSSSNHKNRSITKYMDKTYWINNKYKYGHARTNTDICHLFWICKLKKVAKNYIILGI